ncbi:MAG: HAD family hydrolase [Gemmataceae bacterium]
MPPFRAVLFDFDGTLADSFPAIAASVNHVRGLYGLPPLPVSKVVPHVGRGPEFLLSRTVPGCDPSRDGERYRSHHPLVMRPMTTLMPGAARLVDQLHRSGIELGVCSNKPVAFTRELLAALGVAERFVVVYGPEDVPRPKPAPDMLLAAIDRLGLPSHLALYIGDTQMDIAAAQGAGMPVWAVTTGSDDRATLEAAGPDRIYSGLDAVAEAWVA